MRVCGRMLLPDGGSVKRASGVEIKQTSASGNIGLATDAALGDRDK